MPSLRMELFFQPADSGTFVGKTAWATSATNTTKCCLSESRTLDVSTTFVLVSTQSESYLYMELPVNTSNLVQSNFAQNGANAAQGDVHGVVEIDGNRLFFPKKGICWYDGTDLQIRLLGDVAFYKP